MKKIIISVLLFISLFIKAQDSKRIDSIAGNIDKGNCILIYTPILYAWRYDASVYSDISIMPRIGITLGGGRILGIKYRNYDEDNFLSNRTLYGADGAVAHFGIWGRYVQHKKSAIILQFMGSYGVGQTNSEIDLWYKFNDNNVQFAAHPDFSYAELTALLKFSFEMETRLTMYTDIYIGYSNRWTSSDFSFNQEEYADDVYRELQDAYEFDDFIRFRLGLNVGLGWYY